MLKKKKKLKNKTVANKSEKGVDPTSERKTYLAINAIFAGIIIIIFIYSGFFCPEKNNYPVKCAHEQITGQPCPSCGISRSFSYIIRGDLETAASYNQYGIRLFLFFVFQLVMRFSNIMFIIRKPQYFRQLVIFDTAMAIITFLLAFNQFFLYYFRILF